MTMDGLKAATDDQHPDVGDPPALPTANIHLAHDELLHAYAQFLHEADDGRSNPLKRHESIVRAEQIASLVSSHHETITIRETWYERLGQAISKRTQIANYIERIAPRAVRNPRRKKGE